MIRRFHPLPKLGLFLVWIGASVVVFDLTFQLISFALPFGLLWLVERVALWKLLGLMVPLSLFGFGFLTTSVLFDRESGFALQMAQEQVMARPDMVPGLVLFFRTLACGMMSAMFVMTSDPGQLVRALMIHLRLPASVGLALMQAMHLVPDLARELTTLRMARAMHHDRPLRRFPGPVEVTTLAIPLLAIAIRRATRASIAMEAKGLRPAQPRSHLSHLPIRIADAVGLCVGLATLLGFLLLT